MRLLTRKLDGKLYLKSLLFPFALNVKQALTLLPLDTVGSGYPLLDGTDSDRNILKHWVS